jgi:cation diffusion facilitator CzcD-associated flavoprotein CzcO
MTSDVVVIGAGQAGLAVGYYLRRTGLSHVLLDASPAPGGAWPSTWRSLRLFSPADASSLLGWLMPPASDGYPTPYAPPA